MTKPQYAHIRIGCIVIIDGLPEIWIPSYCELLKSRGETKEEKQCYLYMYNKLLKYYQELEFEVISKMLYKNKRLKMTGNFKMADNINKKRVVEAWLDDVKLIQNVSTTPLQLKSFATHSL